MMFPNIIALKIFLLIFQVFPYALPVKRIQINLEEGDGLESRFQSQLYHPWHPRTKTCGSCSYYIGFISQVIYSCE